MKQGPSHSGPGNRKIEPRAHAVSKTAVADLGIKQGNHVPDRPSMPFRSEELYKGKGYEAPKSGHHIHHSGSQGKHK